MSRTRLSVGTAATARRVHRVTIVNEDSSQSEPASTRTDLRSGRAPLLAASCASQQDIPNACSWSSSVPALAPGGSITFHDGWDAMHKSGNVTFESVVHPGLDGDRRNDDTWATLHVDPRVAR